jgi:hypothetical protein
MRFFPEFRDENFGYSIDLQKYQAMKMFLSA